MSSIPAALRNDFYHSLPSPEDTDQILLQKLQQLYHYRHDLIHHLCDTILGIVSNFNTITKLSHHFGTLLPPHLSKLAPDIVLEKNGVVTLIDISVSKNHEYNFQEKSNKYNPVLIHLKENGFQINEFYMFWVDPLWLELENTINNFMIFCEANNLTYYKPTSSFLDTLRIAHESASEKIQEIRRQVPVECLNMFDHVDNPVPDLISSEEFRKATSKTYPSFEENMKELETSSLEEAETLFQALVQDKEVIDYIKDEKHDHHMYSRAFEKLKELESDLPVGDVKPSFFIPFATLDSQHISLITQQSILNFTGDSNYKLKKEQLQVLQFFSFLQSSPEIKDTDWFPFIDHIHQDLESSLKYATELNIFNTGMLTGNLEDEITLSKQFTDYRKENDSSMSKRTFFKNNMKEGNLKDTLPYVYRNKCIKTSKMIGKSREFSNKSGTSYKKNHEVREYKSKTTIPESQFKDFSTFLEVLEQKNSLSHGIHPFLGGDLGCDSPELINIKKKLLEEQNNFLKIIQPTNCHSFSKHTTLAATQLLHFNELNTTDNTYCCFTTGRPNILHVVKGGSIKRGADIGQAFFTIFLTDDKRWCNSVYGNIEITRINRNFKTLYLCKTPWVRLTSERLSFMKDQYYSTLSTAFDTWARNKDYSNMDGFFTHMYTFRVCVSIAPSQRVAELLMDTRYIFMSALSVYSNVEKLIIDKFAPPYKNVLEQYIVRQLEQKSKQIIIYLANNKPKPHRPGFSGKERLNSTLGGIITMPSLWSNYILQNIQSIFDDIFVYVHTSKEPSSEYHEQIKAINTILKYQKEYDNLNKTMQQGFGDLDMLKKWILSGSQVGCSSKIIYQGSKLFAPKYKNLYKSWEFRNTCTEEPLCNIVSTKACIPEYDRKIQEIEFSKKTFNKVLKNIEGLMKSDKAEYITNNKFVRKSFFVIDVETSPDAEIVITGQNRVKVHDALLDWLKRFGQERNYVIDLATWNIRHNSCKVLTDTCIKAQYGAKREFYVINLGAKAMARVTENSYKQLAKICKNEMISIPGDRKLLHIQNAVNESILSSERRQDTLMYVNGDCTKWSACETMASFLSMNLGLKDIFGEVIYNYNAVTFCSWANKDIQIPQSILQNLRFLSDATSYLEEGTTIKSTQNFLQGMFNYSSSIKAVISTEFALHMFKKLNPNTFLHCSHLEHSDDYSLIIRTHDLDTFEKFRVYHKLSQKLFGINDSIKKTNIQSHIQEFISLFSFNGQLYYPFIKKMKEVGTNLPCNDFRSDAMSIVSRVSECLRIGIPLESAYFMQRVHCASLADAYSLSPHMRNSYGTISDIFSRPIEMFGLPDSLPILSVVVKGNTENFRIYNFGSEENKQILRGLFKLGQETYTTLDLPIANIQEDMGEFYNPIFSYPVRHNRIKNIRQALKLTTLEALEYFNSNLTDSLLKPVETKRFYKWLKSMYFNRSFTRAYMRVSRSAMTLRHSMFSSKPCILEITDHLNLGLESNERTFTTIRNYISNGYNEIPIFSKNLTSGDLKKLNENINCYNSCIQLFYEMTTNSGLVEITESEVHTTVNRMPDPYKWILLENNIVTLLQYLINPINFYSDRRVFTSETSLGRDLKKLENCYNIELLKVSSSYCRQVFSEIMSQSDNKAFGLTFINNIPDLPSFIKQYLEKGFLYGRTFNFLPIQKLKLTSIKDGKHFFTRDWKTNLTTHAGILNQLTLIYRCIVLRAANDIEKTENLTKFLALDIPELTCNVKQFLEKTDLEVLDGINAGELSRKSLCFLKSRLLYNSLDLKHFVDSKFFYEVYYVPSRQVLSPFKEEIIVTFLGIRFKAYLYDFAKKKIVILEMKTTNKVYWFYCYSIAQRAFGIISQTLLDERLIETRDFILPLMPEGTTQLLNKIAISKLEPVFYKKMNKVFRQTVNYSEADLPIVTQDIKFTKHFTNKIEKLTTSNLHTSDFAVFVGNIKLYKLPFGNLIYQNYINLECTAIEEILIDGIQLKVILELEGLLEKYLKTNMDIAIDTQQLVKLLPIVVNNMESISHMSVKYSNLEDIFDLNITNFTMTQPYTIPDKTARHRIALLPTSIEDVKTLSDTLYKKVALGSHDFMKSSHPIKVEHQIDINPSESIVEITALDDLSMKLKHEKEQKSKSIGIDLVGYQAQDDEDLNLSLLFDNSEQGLQEQKSEDLEEKTSEVIIDSPPAIKELSESELQSKMSGFMSFLRKPLTESTQSIIIEKPIIDIGIQLSEEELKSKMGGLINLGKINTESKPQTTVDSTTKQSLDIGTQFTEEEFKNKIQSSLNLSFLTKPKVLNEPKQQIIKETPTIDIGIQLSEQELKSKMTNLFNFGKTTSNLKENEVPNVDIGKQLTEEELKSKMSGLFNFGKPKSIDPKILIVPHKKEEEREYHEGENLTKTIIGTQMSESTLLNLMKKTGTLGKIQTVIKDVTLDSDKTLEKLSQITNSDITIGYDTQIVNTKESMTARKDLEEYTDIVNKRTTNKGIMFKEMDLDSLDLNRHLFATLDDLDIDDMVELLSSSEEETTYDKESSDSSSDDSDGVTWYQLVPTTSLIEGTYNFDEKCKKSMMNLNDYLFTAFIDKDMKDILRNKNDLGMIIVLLNRLLAQKTTLKLKKFQKAVIKSIVVALKRGLARESSTYFMFGDNMGMKFQKNKIHFYAMLPLEDKQVALDRASSNPMVNFAPSVANCSQDVYWLTMPLFQEDLDNHNEKGFSHESLHRNTLFCSVVNEFFPRLKKVEFSLKGKYSF